VPTPLSDILAEKRIVVCVGSGGVGKTSTAAAVAIEGARRGRKTLVLTIDPAKRLASSLGLENLGHEVQQVPAARLDALGERAPGGELWAMMLDQKRAFDEVVERYASNPEAIARILANPVYAQISGALAGSQEYAAIAKLQEFDAAGTYDLIVVDTPPTSHALDFLDAPQKLTAAIDSPAIEWFRKWRGRESKRSGWNLVGKTGSYMFKRIAKFVGTRFLDDLAVFFTEFDDILGGFRERADASFKLLRQANVGFILVSSPEPLSVDEALFFHERLVGSAMPFAAFIVNKVHADLPIAAAGPHVLSERAAALPTIEALGLPHDELEQAIEALADAHAGMQQLARADQQSIDRLREAGGPMAQVIQVPLFSRDIHDVTVLGELGSYLFGRAQFARAAS